MVSPLSNEGSVSTSTIHNRLFIPEETIVAAGPGSAQVTYYRPFWRPVMAGALFTMGLFLLSWYLMLGFHVGIRSDGVLDLGGGAAVWLIVTSCIAYFFGGLIASAMTVAATGGAPASAALKGAVLWGFSIPLSIVLYSFAAQSGGLIQALNLPHLGSTVGALTPGMSPHLGFYWAGFIGLGVGLISAIIGGLAGSQTHNIIVTERPTSTTTTTV